MGPSRAPLLPEDLLRIFVRNTPAAVAMFDRDLRYLLHSDRWCRDYSLVERDLRGRHHYEVFPEIPERWKEIHRRVLSGRVERAVEDRFERADGSTDWVNWECHPWWDARGEVGGLIMFTEVVTDRVRSRHERAQLEERMRNALRLESLGVLAGGVAHDFNNLLVGILGNASLALEQMTEDAAAAAESIREVERAAERAADMTRQLLAFAGRGAVETAPVDLNALVEETLRLVAPSFGAGVEVRVDLAPDVPVIRGDRTLLGQVVMNLLTNASDALGGGGRIDVRTSQALRVPEDLPWVRPPDSGGPFVLLEVRDQGCGMDTATVRRVFDPFFTTKSAGRGLGLAAALGTVNVHSGGIQLWSEPGRGTTFRMVLPADPGPAEARVDPPKRSGPDLGDATVLVVDDERLVRGLVRQALESAGFRVCEADRGDSALKGLREGRFEPDVVLLDVTMPGLSGAEVLAELRGQGSRLPVVLMSGYTADEILRTLPEPAATGLLEKPFRPRDVVAAIQQALDNA